jgi:hypothetical protein
MLSASPAEDIMSESSRNCKLPLIRRGRRLIAESNEWTMDGRKKWNTIALLKNNVISTIPYHQHRVETPMQILALVFLSRPFKNIFVILTSGARLYIICTMRHNIRTKEH